MTAKPVDALFKVGEKRETAQVTSDNANKNFSETFATNIPK